MPAPNEYLSMKDKDLISEGGRSKIKSDKGEDLRAQETMIGDEKKFKHYGATVFGRGLRKSWVVKTESHHVPGPGNYRLQSDFGMYSPSDVYGWTQS